MGLRLKLADLNRFGQAVPPGFRAPPHPPAREEPARYGVLPKDSVCRDNPVLCCMLTSPGPEKIALRKTLPTEILGGIANVV